jgi:hypothetical protein
MACNNSLKQTNVTSFFSFTKSENKRAEQILGRQVVAVWEGRMWGESGGGIWYKYCVHMSVNGKMVPVETIPEIGEGR